MSDTKLQPLLDEIEHTEWATNTTSSGMWTIQQSARNVLSQRLTTALFEDLQTFYPDAQIVRTAEGIIFVVDTDAGPTVSACLKTTIKNLDYDPITESFNYEDQVAQKTERKERQKAEKEARAASLAAKREKKLAELAARQQAKNN